jgi:hypothetical protein
MLLVTFLVESTQLLVVGCPGTPICSGNGKCTSGSCVCNSTWVGSMCDIPNCPGTPDCNLQGRCIVDAQNMPVCSCFDGFAGADCATSVSCTNGCNGNHGTCVTNTSTPYCVCTGDWQGADCSIPICANACSGNGVCSALSNPPQCNCAAGFGNVDCSLS